MRMAMKVTVILGSIIGVFGDDAILNVRHVNAGSARMHRGHGGVYRFLAPGQ